MNFSVDLGPRLRRGPRPNKPLSPRLLLGTRPREKSLWKTLLLQELCSRKRAILSTRKRRLLHPLGHRLESPRGKNPPRFPRTLLRTSHFLQLGLFLARDLLLPRGPSLGSLISVLCWIGFGPRRASSGCPRSRSKLATVRVCGCSRR